MQVDFYHLAASPIERVLPRIAERVLADGGRLLVICEDDGLAARLDQQLWTYAPDSFLPHGRAQDGDGAAQPVLIAGAVDPANGARNVALVDGLWRDEALAFDRAFHFFDDATIDAARMAWKALAGRDGVERNFWKQDEAGRWAKAA
ncbi:DNA polymerase III, chi subunit [Sphingomonas laterariae]|uniref:DNA polymerase III, chi subunit n=1 Tax=Edaphosphingomonas laterariae TaxID=861865 RepID=A0A239DBA8_9SPHN|nr:DNA polymerase III subunit chi [Sphingomonas laterariae]SNS29609.1 DNA polymerase III, chi subunit [Sphingomonas laterariae]